MPVATNASLIAGAITAIDEFEPSFEKVSNIEITVPKRPINGEVEAIMASQARPLVASRSAREIQMLIFSLHNEPVPHFLKRNL